MFNYSSVDQLKCNLNVLQFIHDREFFAVNVKRFNWKEIKSQSVYS